MSCLSCGRSLHEECRIDPCCCRINPQTPDINSEDSSPRRKEVVTVSAGRKRAAVDYKIDSSLPCEWRDKANCGGGLNPIIGCLAGYQTHRHHGPVKDTTRNESGNIHLICVACHNMWHARNDTVYNETQYELLPHSPREATLEELVMGN